MTYNLRFTHKNEAHLVPNPARGCANSPLRSTYNLRFIHKGSIQAPYSQTLFENEGYNRLCDKRLPLLGSKSISVVALLLLVTIVLSGCGDNRRVLSGAEVQALFSGKTVAGHHEKNNYDFISYYQPSGTFNSYQGVNRELHPGKWWVTNRGDICIRWQEESATDLCRKMVTDDEGHYWKVLIKNNNKRVLIVTFNSFVEGNTIN